MDSTRACSVHNQRFRDQGLHAGRQTDRGVAQPAAGGTTQAPLTCTGSGFHVSFSSSRKCTSFRARVPSFPPNRYSLRPSSVAHIVAPMGKGRGQGGQHSLSSFVSLPGLPDRAQ